MDDTLTVHNRGKMEGKPLNLSTAQDVYRETVHRVADEAGLPKDAEMASVVDDGTRMLPVYMRDIDPAITPLAVQKEVTVPVEGVPMLGYIDLVRDAQGSHRIVSDYKFTGKRPSQGAAAASLQLAYYALAEGDPSGHVDLICMVRTKTPQIVTDSHMVTAEDKRRLAGMIRQTARRIASRVYPMASPENEWGNGPSSFCNPTRCGYWGRCRGNPNGPEAIPCEVEV